MEAAVAHTFIENYVYAINSISCKLDLDDINRMQIALN